jgi:hypothetical protein
MDDKAHGINSQFCTRVGVIDGTVDQAGGKDYDAWSRRIRANNIDYSPEMPFVQVTRYSRSDFLRVRAAFNPKASGIENSLAPQRHRNDWHPDNVKRRLCARALLQGADRLGPAVCVGGRPRF